MALVRSVARASGALRQERWGSDLEGTVPRVRHSQSELTLQDLVRRNDARLERFRTLAERGFVRG